MSGAKNPMRAHWRTLVTEELVAIPRGGSYQNMYRMVYQQARLNGLGSRPQVAATSLAAHELALQAVRELQPEFLAELLA